MYKVLYPKKDATIYEKHPERNSGVDAIIEITKFAPGESYSDVTDEFATWDTTYNSRILMEFDLTDLKRQASAAGTAIEPTSAPNGPPYEPICAPANVGAIERYANPAPRSNDSLSVGDFS